MHDITLFISACKQLLDIKTPVFIEFREKTKVNAAAYCWDTRMKGKLVNFRLIINIRIMIESEYDSFSVIAHEFVHAKMIENDSFNPLDHHCPKFQAICTEFEKALKLAKFPILQPLYNQETDDSGQ